MLVSGVIAGIAAGVAFGGDWRRLATFSLRLWPLLVIASVLRLVAAFIPFVPLGVYVVALICVAVVAAVNWRLPGSALIAVGTFMNVLVVMLNTGMPFDPQTVVAAGAPLPNDSLHVEMGDGTRLPLLADIIPVGVVRAVYSAGDFLIGFGGFLIPFMWLQAPPETNAARRELRSTNFALFWLAQVISRFGDPITLVALTFVTYRATQSALLTAIAVVTATLPNALFSLFGGTIADALGHRRAMLWCDIVRVALIGVVPVLLAADAPLGIIFLVVLLAGVVGAIFNPARGAIIPALVTSERLAAANSLVYASDRAVEIGGALAGGVLVATVGEGAFYFDALTFALSAVLISRVVVAEEMTRLTWTRLLTDARDGLLFIRRSAVLWANTLFSLAAQVANPIINSLSPVRRVRGSDRIRSRAWECSAPELSRSCAKGSSADRWLRHHRYSHRADRRGADVAGGAHPLRGPWHRERRVLRPDGHDPSRGDDTRDARARIRRAHRDHQPQLDPSYPPRRRAGRCRGRRSAHWACWPDHPGHGPDRCIHSRCARRPLTANRSRPK